MGVPAEKLPKRATYADLEAVPSTKVAELVAGVLVRAAPFDEIALDLSMLWATRPTPPAAR